MNHLYQIIIAARNDNVEGWTQLLVFVLLAVFWTVSGILKARANKLKQQKKGETVRPAGPGRAYVSPVIEIKPPQRKVSRPQPVHAAVPVWSQAARPVPQPQIPQQTQPAPSLINQADLTRPIEETIESVTEPLAALETKLPGLLDTAKPAGAVQRLFDKRVALRDPLDVKRAIILTEILGRPTALRGPGHGAIGLAL